MARCVGQCVFVCVCVCVCVCVRLTRQGWGMENSQCPWHQCGGWRGRLECVRSLRCHVVRSEVQERPTMPGCLQGRQGIAGGSAAGAAWRVAPFL